MGIIECITTLAAKAIAQHVVSYQRASYSTQYMGKAIKGAGLLPKVTLRLGLIMFCQSTEQPSVSLNVEKIIPALYDGCKANLGDVRKMGLCWTINGYAVFSYGYVAFKPYLRQRPPLRILSKNIFVNY